ncbi:uncharacterized protein B0I36DRAFT_104457 [Microdochium trichocladiopsis]|uniref:Uncharacterized protein n=1 Tax=Microdochium trichocladiopsis TaxID=1682393 RepID=A0A9P8Y953_9PEZI|nr:uncharacterized protein B0I36DRAFT_104457 [Microdochium trichocladiopsis]KAH7033065.1 hypothetical protein B0I36DRAFT_104457 [Microdochium trichocladiopsis]
MSRLHVPEEGFDLSENTQAVPWDFLNARCKSFHVEFLQLSAAGMSLEQAQALKNHVVLKIDFAHQIAGFRGVRVSMDVNQDLASTPSEDGGIPWKPGKMLVKPVVYRGASRSSARTFELEIYQESNLQRFLEELLVYGMQEFSFTNISDRYFGCRDFM